MGDPRRKTCNWLIELYSKIEMSNLLMEMFNWLIEIESKTEISDVQRKIFNWLIEVK
jgi:hypothetical protein